MKSTFKSKKDPIDAAADAVIELAKEENGVNFKPARARLIAALRKDSAAGHPPPGPEEYGMLANGDADAEAEGRQEPEERWPAAWALIDKLYEELDS